MLIFFLLLALLVVKPYLANNFPYTHDGENHLARFANYKLAIKEGQFPPRFAPNLLNHYGYPVFNYNYPLANILSLPFSFLKINYEVTFKILVFGFVIFGLIGLNQWLKSLNFSPKSRLVALLAFGFSPYLANILYFRGNIGELMAMMIFPWLLFFIETSTPRPVTKHFWSALGQVLVWTMFFLSHNVMVLFGTPILVGYALFKYRKQLNKHLTLLLGFGGGLLMSLWFWLPAIWEKNLVILENADLSQGYLAHFPTFSQLLFAPLRFGFSLPGSIDTLSFQIGLVFLLALIIATLKIRNLKESKLKLLLALSWICFFLQLSFSKPLWSIIPFANFIQFPWRLSFFLIILSTPLIAWAVSHSSRLTKFILVVLLLIQAVTVLKLKPADYFHRDQITYDVYPASTSTANENLPTNFTFEYFGDGDWQPIAEIIAGDGSVAVNLWRGSNRIYELNLVTPATIVEPTANFAGWKTFVNEKEISYVNSASIGGRIAYELPAGQHRVQSQFTQGTRARQIGNWLSGLAFVFLAITAIYLKLHVQRKRI